MLYEVITELVGSSMMRSNAPVPSVATSSCTAGVPSFFREKTPAGLMAGSATLGLNSVCLPGAADVFPGKSLLRMGMTSSTLPCFTRYM